MGMWFKAMRTGYRATKDRSCPSSYKPWEREEQVCRVVCNIAKEVRHITTWGIRHEQRIHPRPNDEVLLLPMSAPEVSQSNAPDIIKIILIQSLSTRHLNPLSRLRARLIKPYIQQPNLQPILCHQIRQFFRLGCYGLLAQ